MAVHFLSEALEFALSFLTFHITCYKLLQGTALLLEQQIAQVGEVDAKHY